MNKKRFSILIKAMGVVIFFVIILIVFVPFLIPINPAEGTIPAKDAASSNSKFITIPFNGTDGIDIHYISSELDLIDDKPTYVLLHGSMFNSYTWNEAMDYFSQHGNVIAYDQIPYGLSEKLVAGDWKGRNPYTSEAAVEQLVLFLDVLEINNVVLVGNSYGGVLAVQAALSYPERIDLLVLVDAAVYVKEEMPGWLMELPQVRRLGPLFARQLGQSEAFIRSTYLNPDQISEDRMSRTMIHTQVDNWDFALWEYLRAWGSNADYVNRIADIQQPTLVVSGDGDAIVPISDSQRLDSELPNSELVIIPSCGHVPQEECPEALGSTISEWLNQRTERF